MAVSVNIENTITEAKATLFKAVPSSQISGKPPDYTPLGWVKQAHACEIRSRLARFGVILYTLNG
jgi:hypothetical protein